MRRSTRTYSGSALLLSAAQRLAGTAVVIVLMWLLSAWALGWL